MGKKIFVEPKLQVMILNLSENIAGSGFINGGEIPVTFETRVDGPVGAECTAFVVSWDLYPSSQTDEASLHKWIDAGCLHGTNNAAVTVTDSVDGIGPASGQITVMVPEDLLY